MNSKLTGHFGGGYKFNEFTCLLYITQTAYLDFCPIEEIALYQYKSGIYNRDFFQAITFLFLKQKTEVPGRTVLTYRSIAMEIKKITLALVQSE